jgi:hypothetical protein
VAFEPSTWHVDESAHAGLEHLDLFRPGTRVFLERDTLVSERRQLPSRRDPSLSHCARRSRKDGMPRNLAIRYPDGHREYWFTDQVFVAGDLLDRAVGSWVVVSVGVPNEAGKHTTVVVRPGGRSGTRP